MPIDVLCPGCGKTLRLADEHAGKTGRCPNCQSHFQIPAAPPVPNAPTPSAPGFEQLVAQLQPNSPSANPPAPNSPPKKSLFGEDRPALQAPYQPPSPFADPVPGTAAKPDYSNPYAAPQAFSSPMPHPQGDPNNYSTVATVLGSISIGLSLFGFCCCPLGIFTVPLGIIGGIVGLVLTFQLPRDMRTLPLVLNIISLAMPLVLILIYAVVMAVNIKQGP